MFFLGAIEAKDVFFSFIYFRTGVQSKDKCLMLLHLMTSLHTMYFGREYAEFHNTNIKSCSCLFCNFLQNFRPGASVAISFCYDTCSDLL